MLVRAGHPSDRGGQGVGVERDRGLVLVSIDDHLIEPPDVFDGRVPSKLRDAAPQVVRRPFEGVETEFWCYEERLIPLEGLDGLAARADCTFSTRPRSYRELEPALSDPVERLAVMDSSGVWGSLSYPALPGFGGRLFASPRDTDLALAVVRAYNDWQVEAWAGPSGGRLHAVGLPILWDVEAAVREVERLAALGVRALCFPENPAMLGLPSLHDHSWDPLWAACQDAGVTVMIHMGSALPPIATAADAPVEVMLTVQPFATAACVSDLVWSGVLERFADLRFVMAESGIGWIPSLLERLDAAYSEFRSWTGRTMTRLPSELVRRGIRFGFMADRVGLTSLHEEVTDLAVWEGDYPHSDGCWRDPSAVLGGLLDALTAAEVDAITHRTALELLGSPVPSGRARVACTVETLRSGGRLDEAGPCG